MKVGLIDVDGHRWPNLCLMKLSAYHRARGDTVEWHDGRKYYDLVYMSRMFTDTYSKDDTKTVHADKIIRGGTGYGLGGTCLPRLPFISAVCRHSLRVFVTGLSTGLRFLHCREKGGKEQCGGS